MVIPIPCLSDVLDLPFGKFLIVKLSLSFSHERALDPSLSLSLRRSAGSAHSAGRVTSLTAYPVRSHRSAPSTGSATSLRVPGRSHRAQRGIHPP